MSGFRIGLVKPYEEIEQEVLDEGVFILLVGATEIPPHIVLLVNGGIYSLSIKGKKKNIPSSKYLAGLRAKGTKILMVQIHPAVKEKSELLTSLNAVFNNAPSLDNGVATCLWTVKTFCSDVFYENFFRVNFVFDLIPKLNEINGIGNAYHINMEDDLDEESGFELLEYTMDDIHEKLGSLV